MDNDDVQVGRLMSRREVLALMGAAGVAAAVACTGGGSSGRTATSTRTGGGTPTAGSGAAASATSTGASGAAVPACVVVPALTEGPYFVDEKLNRSDIRSDPASGAVKDGVPLDLTFVVSSMSNGCTPIAGAAVDVWHCDALGVYSDASDPSFNTKGQKFLRGYQLTDAQGRARFTTIYPGWYQGRAVHIHFKVRTEPQSSSGAEFTSQFFFDETLNDTVLAQQPYAQKPASGRLRNSGDSIFQQSNGLLMLSPEKSGGGYAATFPLGMRV